MFDSLFKPNIEKLQAKRDVKGLIKALNYQKNATIRRNAARALGDLKDTSTVGSLIAALKDSESDVRQAAVTALGQLGDLRAVEPIITALNDGNSYVRLGAVRALGQLDDAHVIEPLIAALQNSNEDVRNEATSALVKIGASAVEPLITALKDSNHDVRVAAVRALGQLGDTRAVKPLITLIRNSGSAGRQAAELALGQIGIPAIPELVTALKEGHDKSSMVGILDKIGWQPTQDEIGAIYWITQRQWNKCAEVEVAAVAPLIAVLYDIDRSARIGAVSALVKIGAPAVDPLIVALKDINQDVRYFAADALGQIGDSRAVEPLIAALKDSNPDVHETAVLALGQIGDSHAVEPLIAVLKDSNPDVRQAAAARALGEIGDARAVGPLLDALKDNDSEVRKSAAGALKEIGWQPGNDENSLYFWIVEENWDRCIEMGAPAVEHFIAELKHGGKRGIKTAADVLRKIGAPAVEPLIAVIKQGSDGFYDAVDVLGWIGDTRAVEPLIAALQVMDRDRRKDVISVLDNLGWQPAHDEVRAAEWIKQRRWEKCIEIGGPAVEPLIAALVDSNENVRNQAKLALGNIGAPAVEPLVATLEHSDKNVRKAALDALDKIGWQPTQNESGAHYWIEKGEWNQCVRIGAPAIQPLLVALKDNGYGMRKSAAGALKEIGWQPGKDENSVHFWIAEEKWDRCVEIGALAIEHLIAELQSPKGGKDVADALEKIGTPAVEWLIAVLKQGSVGISYVVDVLGKIGDARAVEPLLAALNDTEIRDYMRHSVAKALVRIYQSGKIDESLKRLIIAQRSRITASRYHIDFGGHSDYVTGGGPETCSAGQHTDQGSDHTDSVDGVDFPL